jgi:hypothetical protein
MAGLFPSLPTNDDPESAVPAFFLSILSATLGACVVCGWDDAAVRAFAALVNAGPSLDGAVAVTRIGFCGSAALGAVAAEAAWCDRPWLPRAANAWGVWTTAAAVAAAGLTTLAAGTVVGAVMAGIAAASFVGLPCFLVCRSAATAAAAVRAAAAAKPLP